MARATRTEEDMNLASWTATSWSNGLIGMLILVNLFSLILIAIILAQGIEKILCVLGDQDQNTKLDVKP
jgi:hypothetical protein